MAEITITRKKNSEKGCTGVMSFEKHPLITFATLEDCDRFLDIFPSKKQYGETAIPCGIYEAVLENHSKFGLTFRLHDVPNYEGVLCPHVGNTIKDTKGCILIGEKEANFMINNSANAKKKFDEIIRISHKIGEKIKVEVKRAYSF